MSYLLLITERSDDRLGRPKVDGQAAYDEMVRFTERLRARHLLEASDSLRYGKSAARVTVRGGKRTVVDGPFAEAKEIVGGFFLLR